MTIADRSVHADRDPASGAAEETSRGSVLPLLLRAIVVVLLFTLAVGYVARERSEAQAPVYEASARVVLSSSSNFSPLGTYNGGVEDRFVANQASIMTTLPVLDRAAAIVADGSTGADLREATTATPAGPSDVITITTQAGEPELAARRADAVARAYAQFTAEEVRVLADAAIAAAAGNVALAADIRARAASYGDGVTVIEPADVPSSPASPTPSRDAFLAAVAAFLVSAGLALLWLNWRRPAGPERLAAAAGGTLLGRVPVRWLGSLPVPRQPGRAAYGVALQAIRYSVKDGDNQSVLLTSVGHETHATSALLGLAAADAATGRNVVLLDATADGRLIRRAGVAAPAVSLSTAAAGHDGVERGLVSVPALAGPHGGSVRIARMERLPVAGGSATQRALAALRSSGDLVLVDAGSIVEDATAFALLGEVGAVVAVVPAKSRGRRLPDLRRRLQVAGRRCDGVLLARRTFLPPLTAPLRSNVPQFDGASARTAPRKTGDGARGDDVREPSGAAGRTS